MNYVQLNIRELWRALETSNESLALQGNQRAAAPRTIENDARSARLKLPLLAFVLALAYLQYYFAGVMTTIAALPAVIVFVPLT